VQANHEFLLSASPDLRHFRHSRYKRELILYVIERRLNGRHHLMISVALAKIVSDTGSKLAEKFGDSVVQRWTRHRAQCFIEAFVESLWVEHASGREMPEVDEYLDEILADETKGEILFDAYRRVCFTKSKTLGPRIIGLLTGQLVMEGRAASEGEESIFEAAEMLSDGEFMDFLKAYQEYCEKAAGVTDLSAEVCKCGKAVMVRWYREELDTYREIELGPFPWVEALGPWAVKLNRSGLLSDRTRQKSDPYAGMHGMKFETHITFESPCAELSRLLLRSLGFASRCA
jgi:hypothetical protein